MSMFAVIFKKELWTPRLLAWYLYDFANSLLIINITLYFSQWVVIDKKVSDFWFAVPFVIATLILVFLSPYAGELGDRKGKHYIIFVLTTLGAIGAAFLMFLIGRLSGNVTLALVLYGAYQLLIQTTFIPYDAFLKYLVGEGNYGKVSGIGFAFGQAGNILGLLLTLPIIRGQITFLGSDRLVPMLAGGILFLILALPSFFLLRIKQVQVNLPVNPSFFSSLFKNLKESKSRPGVLPFLLSFYFFSDAILTLNLFSAIYLQNVFSAPDTFKVKILILVFLGFLFGAFGSGAVSDIFGHRRVLLLALAGTAASIAAIALVGNLGILLLLFQVFGFAIGVVYATSRAYLASLIPPEESGKFFGLYVFAERFASVVGPLVWGITIWGFSAKFPFNYRLAALAMAGLVIIGILPLVLNKEKMKSWS